MFLIKTDRLEELMKTSNHHLTGGVRGRVSALILMGDELPDWNPCGFTGLVYMSNPFREPCSAPDQESGDSNVH